MTGHAGDGATPAAEDFLGPTLLGLVESVRATTHRVIASGRRGGGAGAESDEEAVHDFRVALRRLRTLLRPARRVYGKKRLRPIAEDLRAYAQATGTLRDEEVLRETLTALDLRPPVRAAVDAWIGRRGRKERGCRAAVVQMLRDDVAEQEARAARMAALGHAAPPEEGRGPSPGQASGAAAAPRLSPALSRLVKRLAKRKGKRRSAASLALRAVEEALSGVRSLASGDPADGAAMHALRIRFKRLRYSAETFAPLLGERAGRAAKSAAKMQKRLGQLHDVDEALLRMRRAWGLSPADRAEVTEALLVERARLVGKTATDLAEELAALAAEWPPG